MNKKGEQKMQLSASRVYEVEVSLKKKNQVLQKLMELMKLIKVTKLQLKT